MSNNNEDEDELTLIKDFKEENMVFAKVKHESVPGTPIKYKRINISVKQRNGIVGDLVIPTPGKLFSFGVGENKSPETGKLTGYSLSLCLESKDGATEEELAFIGVINSIVAACHKQLLLVKNEIGQHDLEQRDFRKMFPDPIYRKKDENGKVVPGKSPVLYPKLLVSKDKKTGELINKTVFYEADKWDEKGNALELELKDVLGVYFTAKAAIKIESLYIGGEKFRLQLKVMDADVLKMRGGKTSYTRRKRPQGKVASDEEKAKAKELSMSNNEGNPPKKEEPKTDKPKDEIAAVTKKMDELVMD